VKIPTRNMAGGLRWTRNGTVWADWILTPRPYGLRPLKERKDARDLHTALFRSLPGDSLLLGLVSGLDPAAVVERMLADVDLSQAPEWVAECEATLETLDELGLCERVYWLSVPLGLDKPADKLLEPVKSKHADLLDWLGLPPPGVSKADVERRVKQAERIRETIPAPFEATPATTAQMVWLHEHQVRRGLYLDLNLPAASAAAGASWLESRSSAALSEPVLDEGGQSDLSGPAARLDPARRRFLKVTDGGAPDVAPSYQALSVLSNAPDAGFIFPGGELLGGIDKSGLLVEWGMRLTVKAAADVMKTNRRALRNLNDQYVQQDESKSVSGLSTIDRAAVALREYAATLESDKLEVETQATMIFCLASTEPDELRRSQHALNDFVANSGYRLSQPLGYQESFWWALQPGVPTSRQVREFAQITTSQNLAALVPLASDELGDSKGSLFGINIANGPLAGPNMPSGLASPVLHDLEGASDRHTSGSIAIAGEPGGGKSTAIKGLLDDVIDRGGHCVIVDHTQVGEYEFWARGKTQTVVVDVDEPAVSLDPLRLFGPKTGARVAQSFLTPLLNVSPSSPIGVLLSEVLEPAYLAKHQLTSLGALVDHLGSGDCPDSAALEAARRIRVFGRKDIGRVIFDATVPTLDISTRAIVIRTHTLQLPSEAELVNEHLFEQLPLEKVFGRAFYSLIAEVARHVCFSDPTVLGAFALDESHSATVSFEVERVILEFIRDGRKHRAVVILGSQDPMADFGSDTLRGLVPTRVLTRQRDVDLAISGIKWIGLDPIAEPHLIDVVARETSPVPAGGRMPLEHRLGEGLMRDSSSNIGLIKMLLPARAERREAVKSTPRRKAAA
jgi:hypothetical protein